MAPEFDESDFIDRDYEAARKAAGPGAAGGAGSRPPSREELEGKVSDTHRKLAELKRAQEALERERTALEEARRRRTELHQGHAEMLHHLTRGMGLLEEAQLKAQREAGQMAQTLEAFRAGLLKVQSIREESWTQENWNTELSKALTTLENARMEWNSARLRWPLLDGVAAEPVSSDLAGTGPGKAGNWASLGFFKLARIGLAVTFPLLVLAVLALLVWLVYLFRH